MIDYERTYKMAAKLLDCACNTLALTTDGCPGRRCVVAGVGTLTEHVNCCHGPGNGQLTVNAVRAFLSRSFPIADVTSNNCDAPWTVVTYNVQVIRCHPAGSIERAPSCDVLDDVAHLTMVDMDAVRNGVVCCLRDTDATAALVGHGYRWSLGDQTTYGPEGMCVGSNLEVIVGLPTCWEC